MRTKQVRAELVGVGDRWVLVLRELRGPRAHVRARPGALSQAQLSAVVSSQLQSASRLTARTRTQGGARTHGCARDGERREIEIDLWRGREGE